ncbi:zinc carboxypeptidase [Fulvivirga lutea]|uniref:Zinc carboxypeptidase n=2 Tax=Fulvivirga lutea TaxID=2810512 RepID=A0A975A382_9BACT|nr:zinc carboxypeptidase [Fulvivirga lutea]
MRFFILIILLTTNSISFSQADLSYYLPSGVTYKSDIPEPSDVLGHEVGEWHVSHDKLVEYMRALDTASDRITLEVIGKTYEGRPLINLIITSPSNHQNLENLQNEHITLTDPSKSSQLAIENMPAVFYMGYSIHGNEPSGSNTSLLVAYYLAAAQGSYIDKILDETIILLDPSFNPDGLNRFANYVNANKSSNTYDDPNNRELNEPWPGGRTNHYWFDLNRDWLVTQLPESQARIAQFHKWKPNLLTDHHEMGSNNTFFFQPGIPSRNNPKTPAKVFELTAELGRFHAQALDSIGSLYYTQESYDDFYYGKGSTYPDINGGIGILFEQASSRGHARETENGVLTFPFTIRNQFNTALSSLKGLNQNRDAFLNYQRSYFKDAYNEATKSGQAAIVFGSKDKWRNYHLAELMNRHGISVYQSKSKTKISGQSYEVDESYVVPLNNSNYRLIKAMFDVTTNFQDSLFYDVSAWTLPMAFNIDYETVNGRSFNANMLGQPFSPILQPKGKIVGDNSDYAYVFEWNDYYSPKALYYLLKNGFKLKVATQNFTSGDKNFEVGTILIPVGIQLKTKGEIHSTLKFLSEDVGIDIHALKSGLNYETVSLGSPSFETISIPSIAILVGESVRSYDAGEVWHLFDQRMDMEATLLPVDRFSRVSLDRYNVIVMVDGYYSALNINDAEKLKEWVKNGGLIVGSQGALKYLNKIGLGKFEMKKSAKSDSSKYRKYSDIDAFEGAQEIGGAIFNTRIDLTHPLFYGYQKEYLPVFRNSEDFLPPSTGAYSNPMMYTENPLLSGYISEENLEMLKNSSGVGISSYGQGKVIGFTDDLNFRAFWYGTNKTFLNAIFFGKLVDRSANR